MSYQGFVENNLLTNVSADETTSPWVNVQGRTNVTFFVSGLGTTSGGVITFEETRKRADGSYVATSSVLTTVNASTVTAGVEQAVHVSGAAFSHVRARVSTAISGGGTISVSLVAA